MNKTEISFDDFSKIDLRVGTILSVEPVPKSHKLLKLEVDFGELGKRTILSGIATAAVGEVVVGKKVVAVVNLAPRKMMGVESHGMLLAAHDESQGIVLASCAADPGAEVG